MSEIAQSSHLLDATRENFVGDFIRKAPLEKVHALRRSPAEALQVSVGDRCRFGLKVT